MKPKYFILMALCLFSLNFISSEETFPGIPHQFYGEVVVNNTLVPDNNIIIAAIGGNYYSTVTKDGFYGFSPNIFYVEDPDGNRLGKTISFYLGGRVINGVFDFRGVPVGNVEFENNGFDQLDISTTTTCNDGYCIGDETCSSCPGDCGVCLDPPIITINSPINQVYNTIKIDLDTSADQTILMWLYALNSDNLITFTPPIILNAEQGENTVTVMGINSAFQSGSKSVTFTVNVPYCGNSVCDNGEDCSSCPGDCGACPTSSPSSGSSGGSSGSSGAAKPKTNQTNNTIVNLNLETPAEQENNNQETTSQEEIKEKNFFRGILGAVTGLPGELGSLKSIIVIVFVVGIVAAFIVIAVSRRKNISKY